MRDASKVCFSISIPIFNPTLFSFVIRSMSGSLLSFLFIHRNQIHLGVSFVFPIPGLYIRTMDNSRESWKIERWKYRVAVHVRWRTCGAINAYDQEGNMGGGPQRAMRIAGWVGPGQGSVGRFHGKCGQWRPMKSCFA